MALRVLKNGLDVWKKYTFSHIQHRNKSCQGEEKRPYLDIECKVALITGGSSGIGLGIANELLKNGAKVVVISDTCNDKGEEAMKTMNDTHGGGRCVFMNLNTKNGKQFEGRNRYNSRMVEVRALEKNSTYLAGQNLYMDVFKAVFHKYGSLDILVNNAGMLSDKFWEETISVNLNGVIRGILLGHKYMPTCNKPKGGIVLNIGSKYSFDAFPYAPIYNMTKHGIVGLTRSFGDKIHHSETGVRVVALCPGVTKTKLVARGNGEMLTEEWTEKTYTALDEAPQQSVTATSNAAVYVIKHADSGTCWPVEAHVLYKAEIPDRKTYSAKILELS